MENSKHAVKDIACADLFKKLILKDFKFFL